MVSIRRAEVDDIGEIMRLRLAMQKEFAWAGLTAPGVTDEEGFLELNQSYFERAFPAGTFVGFVAEDQREMVGISGMVMYEAPPTGRSHSSVEGYILNMYTVPERRGEGIAGALLDRLVQHARSLGVRRVWLRTSEMGRSVYEKAGFEGDIDNLRLDLGRPPDSRSEVRE